MPITMTDKLEALDRLLDTLGSHRYSFGSEAGLQAGVAAALNEAGWSRVREASLGDGDRVDFLVDGWIALEVKVDGSADAVARQLARYCRHEQVEVVVLVTSRIKHTGVPMALAGTPIEVVYVGEGLV